VILSAASQDILERGRCSSNAREVVSPAVRCLNDSADLLLPCIISLFHSALAFRMIGDLQIMKPRSSFLSRLFLLSGFALFVFSTPATATIQWVGV